MLQKLKEIKIEVTNQCYRNCKHCSSDATCDREKELTLDKETVMRVIKEAHESGAESVAFTGGEATLYLHLSEVIKHAKSLGMETKLYTMCYRNDTNLAILKQLSEAGLSEIIYSTTFPLVVSPDHSTYSLPEFIALLATQTNLKIGFHHVITNETLDCLSEAPKYMEMTAGRLSKYGFLRLVEHGRANHNFSLSEEERVLFKDFVISMREKYGDKIKIGSPFNILAISNTSCNAAEETIIVGFDGRVYPCDAMKYFNYFGSGGNVYQDSLKDILNSKYFKDIRELKKNHNGVCKSCSDYDICESGCLGQKMVYMTNLMYNTSTEWYDLNAKRTMNHFDTREKKKLNAWTGIAGETGSLFDCIKKLFTHDCFAEQQALIKRIKIYEIGDTIWYLAGTISSYFQISFTEICNHLLNEKVASVKLVDENMIRHCVLLPDPECPKGPLIKERNISKMDNILKNDEENNIMKVFESLDRDAFRLREFIRDCNVSKQDIITASATLLYDLGIISHKYLNVTLEEVLTTNILKLRNRYPMGFDNGEASMMIEAEAEYKNKEIKGYVYQKNR